MVIPSTQTSRKLPLESLELQFRRLAAAWQVAVAYQSSSTMRSNHPAYREIISLGPEVVPLLLRDMEGNQTHWFCALREITGADPIPAEAAGNIPKMIEAWRNWSKENGYQW